MIKINSIDIKVSNGFHHIYYYFDDKMQDGIRFCTIHDKKEYMANNFITICAFIFSDRVPFDNFDSMLETLRDYHHDDYKCIIADCIVRTT